MEPRRGAGGEQRGAALPAPDPRDPRDPSYLRGDLGARALALLATGSPEEVLARIVPGDPLGLRPRAGERLRARCLCFDVERVLLRTLALGAFHAPRWRGRPALEPWLDELVERALDELVAEDAARTAEPDGKAPDESHATPAFRALAAELGLDAPTLAEGCRRFHGLESGVRRAFFLLVIEGRALAEVAARLELPAVEVARAARRGLDAFLPARAEGGGAERLALHAEPGAEPGACAG